jgi:hypothetical protein
MAKEAPRLNLMRPEPGEDGKRKNDIERDKEQD